MLMIACAVLGGAASGCYEHFWICAENQGEDEEIPPHCRPQDPDAGLGDDAGLDADADADADAPD